MPKVGHNPRNGSWEREFEKNGTFRLPDCRLKFLERDKARVFLPHLGQGWDTVFCAICGKPEMAVPPDCPHVYYQCQQCFNEHGAPPDAIQVLGT